MNHPHQEKKDLLSTADLAEGAKAEAEAIRVARKKAVFILDGMVVGKGQ